ncbi:MAG: bacillithiol biosynthesis cysteine-adding enzyme BshC [Ignavibacterium sp.]|jgi:bacillithiol biosynthesis cysteine-adding enzyme BshC|nr:bacillithiol biosynthesis cysteine-adding enzyme BshC [Ignavibacterium sp.]
MFINFSDIPRNQNLFLDYVYEFENVQEYYKHNFRNKENFSQLFKNISASRKDKHLNLSAIIKNQYSSLQNISNKTLKNISDVDKEKTIAVVTGQQLGIIGGPLYTIYKIITIIKLTNQLRDRYEEYNFVPIFWLEGDDHDFNEVRSINLFDNENQVINIGYKEEISDDDAKQSIGKINFDEALNNFFTDYENSLRATDFKDELIFKLKEFYQVGKSFKQSFKELLFWLFDEYGLIVFDPQDVQVKTLLKDIFKKEVNDFGFHTQKLIQVSAKLEELYHAQVKVKPVNLFYHTDDGRYSVEPVDDIFKLRRKRKQFTKEEILSEIENFPERFSPNVLLRPICQDFLFPTGFYIGGPSEVAYFAQALPLYDFYNLQAPIIYPRSSATLLEKNVANGLDKYDLSLNDIFLGLDELKEKVIADLSENNIANAFEDASKEIELIFDKINENLFAVDKTLLDASGRYKDRVMSSVNELKAKAIKAQETKHETTIRQLTRLSNLLYPMGNLQEREINFTYFYNKYGKDLINKIYSEISITEFEHQIISI